MEQVKRAQVYLDDRNFEEALKIYLPITKGDPQNALAYQGIAECYYYLGQFEKAVESAEKAIAIDPTLLIPHTILAFTYGRNGNLEKSRSEAQVALKLVPNSYEALICYGVILLLHENYNEAESYLTKASLIKPSSIPAHQNLSIVYERLGKINKYVQETRIIFLLKPTVANGLRLLVAFHRRYALLLSIGVPVFLLLAVISKMEVFLIIPGFYIFWAGYLSYLFAKNRNWRNATVYLIATAFFALLLYIIYSAIHKNVVGTSLIKSF
jgi:tetratricopeptide (TPR) repeat protein